MTATLQLDFARSRARNAPTRFLLCSTSHQRRKARLLHGCCRLNRRSTTVWTKEQRTPLWRRAIPVPCWGSAHTLRFLSIRHPALRFSRPNFCCPNALSGALGFAALSHGLPLALSTVAHGGAPLERMLFFGGCGGMGRLMHWR